MENDEEVTTKSPTVTSQPMEVQKGFKSFSPGELKRAMAAEVKKREIIKEFVQSQLVEKVDYGTIEATSKSGKSFKSKPCLFKPGMEKILSLFSIVSTLEKDTDTWEMLGSKPSTVCYRCHLLRGGNVIAEGRGIATVGEKDRDANSTVKIAEKRARMDACLSLGFSEYFTQDLEDMQKSNQQTEQPSNPTYISTISVNSIIWGEEQDEVFLIGGKKIVAPKGSGLEEGGKYKIRLEKRDGNIVFKEVIETITNQPE
jgi:hypothetical protein